MGRNIQYFRRIAAIARSCSARSVRKRALPSKVSPPMDSLIFRCLLDVADPLALHVGGADVEPVVVQNEPDRNFVRLPGLAPVMGQPRGLLPGYPPQSRKFGRFHQLSSGNFITNQETT
jgi:hypothetical protein